MNKEISKPPVGLKALSIVLFIFGIFAFFGSLFLWGDGILFRPPQGVDLSFPITDILVNAPASILAAIGLWQLRRYGYVVSQFVAGFYVYASVEIFVHVFQTGPPFALEILIPQVFAVLTAAVLVFYLWRLQPLFFQEDN